MLAHEHVSLQDMLTSEHISLLDMLANEHASMQGTWACEYVMHAIKQIARHAIKQTAVDNMKKNPELNGYLHDFSVNYNIIDIRYIVDINKYLLENII